MLRLEKNNLRDLPQELENATSLKIIFLSGNKLGSVPKVLAKLSSLEMLGLRSCGISEISGHDFPPSLRWLILTDNKLDILPDDIGRLTQMKKFMLSGARNSAVNFALIIQFFWKINRRMFFFLPVLKHNK